MVWLFVYYGRQQRQDLVAGAAQSRNFASAVRVTQRTGATSSTGDLLHERLNYPQLVASGPGYRRVWWVPWA
jgi:hypothetical protein